MLGGQGRNRTTDTRIFNLKALKNQQHAQDFIKDLSVTNGATGPRRYLLDQTEKTAQPGFYRTSPPSSRICCTDILPLHPPRKQAAVRPNRPGPKPLRQEDRSAEVCQGSVADSPRSKHLTGYRQSTPKSRRCPCLFCPQHAEKELPAQQFLSAQRTRLTGQLRDAYAAMSANAGSSRNASPIAPEIRSMVSRSSLGLSPDRSGTL